jgi:16S rRNA (adenine1518-N6/adenine1519-N6)-dimethyltransferase
MNRPSRSGRDGHNGHKGKNLFQDRGLHAKKSFGQCFLADPNIARRIAREAVVEPGCTTLEIGAGTGALTVPLLDRGAHVIAIERDRDLVPVLRESLADAVQAGQLAIHELDAASCDWSALLAGMPRPHVVVGNVPYQITGRLLERATAMAGSVQRVVFMIQKEVADRIEAPCGTRDYGALSVFVRRSFRVVRRIAVPPTCFRPQPSVHSAIVVFEPLSPPPEPVDGVLRELVLTAFSHRRKTLRNAWRGAFRLEDGAWVQAAADCGIRLDVRAETLTPQDFDRVASWVREKTR